MDKFVDLYPSKHVTPYLHCMCNHIHEFMTTHSSILQFTQQGIEKYNDTMTKDDFHHSEASLTQILQKQNRIEHLQTLGIDRKKRQIKCGHQVGHNKLTCKQNAI